MDKWFGVSEVQRKVTRRSYRDLETYGNFEKLVNFLLYLAIINAKDWTRTRFWMRIRYWLATNSILVIPY